MNGASLKVLTAGLALIGLAVTACTEEPLEPRAVSLLADAPPSHQILDMNVIQSVCGNAHLIDGSVDRTITFNILKRADGTVEGWYHILARGSGGAHVRIWVECLHVVENQAWATGTIVAANNPDNIGRPYSMRFIDNAENQDGAPDEIGGEAFIDYDCTTEPEIPVRELTIGNLQVRG